MATLAGFSGSSLVPDVAGAIREDIGEFATRKREKAEQADLEQNLVNLFNEQGDTAKQGDALGILGQLSPELAQTAEQVRKSNDPEQINAFRAEIDKGGRDAKEMLDLNTHAERKKLIERKFAETAAKGGDTSRLVELSNMPEGKLQLELTKMGLQADAARRIIPASAGSSDPLRFFSSPGRRRAFAKIQASNPGTAATLLSARNAQLGRDATAKERSARAGERSAARQAQAAVPKTELGRTIANARADIASGAITPGVGNQLIEQARTQAVAAAPPAFKSSVGKLVGDLDAATQVYGAKSPQAKAINQALTSETKGEAPSLSDEKGIRNEFTKASSTFVNAKNAIDKITISAKPKTAISDVSLIFAYMKLLDENSTVREGEKATIEQTRGIPDDLVALYNKATDGAGLVQKQRDNIVSLANDLFSAKLSDQRNVEKIYGDLAERSGIARDKVVLDFVNLKAAPENMLNDARDAISRGADRDAVIKRMREQGIDPSGL